jgi:hypothetical protein
MAAIDVEISGAGFYTIVARSRCGKAWMRRVEGFDGYETFSDDARLTQEIADGALSDGLRVSVNGKTYLGDNRCS